MSKVYRKNDKYNQKWKFDCILQENGGEAAINDALKALDMLNYAFNNMTNH